MTVDYGTGPRHSCIKIQDFGGGVVEIGAYTKTGPLTASMGDRPDENPSFAWVSSPKREKTDEERSRDSVDASVKRSRRMVRQKCKVIKADRMLTLTYRENMQDRDRMARDWDLLRRRISKAKNLASFRYVAVLERQLRGAWHMHIALHGRRDVKVLRSLWLSVVGANNGNVDISYQHGRDGSMRKLSAYLAKYISKGVDDVEAGQKRYWSSRGIDLPEKITIWLAPGASFDDAVGECLGWFRAYSALYPALWVDNDRCIFWIATG